MGMFNQIRYEAQLSVSGRALCKICGNKIEKGLHILKILGAVNESLHPECVVNLTLQLRDLISGKKDDKSYAVRATLGIVKEGFYEDTKDPKKKRFTTTNVTKLIKGEK